MKKFVLLSFLFCVSAANAQMIDLLGGAVVGGTVAREEAHGLKRGLDMIQQNNLINKINMLIMDASFKENKKSIKKTDFSYDLSPLKWNVYSNNDNEFTLSFEDIDKPFCTKMITSFHYKSVNINNKNEKKCQEKNNIKFIF